MKGEERRPLTRETAPDATTSTDIRISRNAVLPFLRSYAENDSDIRLGGELAAARVLAAGVDSRPEFEPSCPICASASLEWLAWAGREYGCCPHFVAVA